LEARVGIWCRHDSPLSEGQNADGDDPTDERDQNEKGEWAGESGLGEDAPVEKDEKSSDREAEEHEKTHHASYRTAHVVDLILIHWCLREMETNLLEMGQKSKSKSEVWGERLEVGWNIREGAHDFAQDDRVLGVSETTIR
jgi:hypothetical protein